MKNTTYYNTKLSFRDTVKSKKHLNFHLKTLTNLSSTSYCKNPSLSLTTFFKTNPTSLTEKYSEYLSTLYTTYDYKGISSRYNIPSTLSIDEQSQIKSTMKRKKDSGIIYSSNQKEELFSDPFKAKEILNINNEVYKTILNIRMKTQNDKFVNIINDVMEKKERKSVASSLMFSPIKGKKIFGWMTREQMINEIKISIDII